MMNWPEDHLPDRSRVHVKNELDMDVKPDIVWAWLVRAQLWPSWYTNSTDVTVEGGSIDLGPRTKFRWKTFGVTLDSVVEEFSPFERLAWSARARGIDAYHAWLVSATPVGCHVVTEETQNGWLATLGNALRPNNMSQKHQMWLEGLLVKARTGPPP